MVGMSQCGGWLIEGKMAGLLLPCSTSPTQDPGNVPPALASEPSQASTRAVSPTHRKSTKKIKSVFGFDGVKQEAQQNLSFGSKRYCFRNLCASIDPWRGARKAGRTVRNRSLLPPSGGDTSKQWLGMAGSGGKVILSAKLKNCDCCNWKTFFYILTGGGSVESTNFVVR